MPLTPAFTVGNNSGLQQSNFQIVDTSTGSDGTIAKFVVIVYDSANNQITGSPVTFTYSLNASYNVSILTQDIAVNVVIQWQTSGGAVVQTTSQIFVFTGYLEWFYYALTQMIAANNKLLVDRDFFANWSKLRTLIDSANQAITVGASIFNAQAMILLAQYMSQNTTLFF